MQTLLELKNVSFGYEETRPALKDVSTKLYSGQKVAIMGNNGAGKSTFFLMCIGLLKPSDGELIYKGNTVKYKKSELIEIRKHIGAVFQDADFQIIASTVESEISFGPMNLRLPTDDVERRIEESLSTMNLTNLRTRPPHQISGGEKKRVTIASILAMEPELILFDEPTSSLDIKNTVLLEDTLDVLHKKGIGLVVATHDSNFIYRFAERVLVFSDGNLIGDGTPEEVFADESLVERAGQQCPLLFDVCKTLGIAARPKTIEEFRGVL